MLDSAGLRNLFWEEGQIEEMRRAIVSAGLAVNSLGLFHRGKLHLCLNTILTLEGYVRNPSRSRV